MGLMRRQSSQLRIFLAVFCFLIFLLWQSGSLSSCTSRPETFRGPIKTPQQHHLPCRDLPGANDTVVIVKTGSTELQDKLPIHFSTTLRCYPNYLIFSDYEEYVQGEHIIDALDKVSPELKANHPDFRLHRRLREKGRLSLAPEELNGGIASADAWTGHVDNPGWKLDKWKFLPMVERTLEEYPDKKWYVFVEADTYILWASLLQFLAALDPNQARYTGNQMAIGDDLFAHGGSGFVVSLPALRRVVEHYHGLKDTIESFTDSHWAGDCVLGKAFRESGTTFTYAWPVLQTDHPGMVPYTNPDGRLHDDIHKRPWCYPSVTYHHISSEVMEDLWNFEQQWIGSKDPSNTGFFKHKDFFAQYVIPRMLTPKTDWDNLSKESEQGVHSFEDCRAICESRPECKQYALHQGGVCKLSYAPMLGLRGAGIKSGWLVDRMWHLHDTMPACTNEGWPV